MKQTTKKLYSFLRAVRGNWRNAIYLTCEAASCPYEATCTCDGYLLAVDGDGRPLILSVDFFQSLTGESVVKDECITVLKRTAFESIYSLYIDWHTSSSRECAVKELAAFLIKPIQP